MVWSKCPKTVFYSRKIPSIGVCSAVINKFQVNVSFLYPLKKSENQRFSDVLGGGGTEREHWLQMSYQNNGGIKYN